MSDRDAAQIQAFMAGDEEAMVSLLARHGERARRRVVVPERWRSLLSIDDILQETYSDVLQHVGRFEPGREGAFEAWFMTLARNNLRDAMRHLAAEKRGGRRRKVEPKSEGESLLRLYDQVRPATLTPTRCAAKGEAEAALVRVIARLPEDYSRVIQLYYIEGRNAAEVGAEMARTPGAVHMLRTRALDHLRDLMGRASRFLSGA
ncbi:MAG: sigma-70 family RNA polymerase sigma factor [Planctomycetota bacterium]